MQLLCTLEQPEQHTWTIAWHPNGRILASAGSDRKISIWQFNPTLTSSQKLQTLPGDHSKSIRTLSFSPNGNLLCSGSFDSTLVLYTLNSQNQYSFMTRLQGHDNEVKCVAWNPAGNKIASCSRDKNVWVWEVDETGEDFLCANILDEDHGGHKQDVKVVGWVDNCTFVSGGYDDVVRVWEYEDDDVVCRQVLEGHASTVWALAFKGENIVSVSEDMSVKLWGNKEGGKYKLIQDVPNLHERAIYTCDFNSEKKILATGGADNRIILSKFEDDKIIPLTLIKDDAHKSDINCLRFHPKEKNILASCGDDNEINIWKINDII